MMSASTGLTDTEKLIARGTAFFDQKGWVPFSFQLETWEAYLKGENGLVNAPTGSGKTYSLIIPILLEFLRDHPEDPSGESNGLQAIWITPIRALTREIQSAAQEAVEALGLNWKVGIRSGDTSSSQRRKQKEKPPEILITTPESLHLLLAQKGYPKYFRHLKSVVVDEWHELMGSKRGVQMELALSRLQGLLPHLKTWGISATIGNMQEAMQVLFGPQDAHKARIIRSGIEKVVEVSTLLPDEIETFPWAGHLGIRLLEKVIPIIESSQSTLIFTNTRAQCEIWYQQILEVAPDLAGAIAMHHGSISRDLRDWVENALHEGKLKAVVCTASLDLGVDFRPVETIVQIGSPKGVARFMQRAGRSGHQPGAVSKIHFVPTHSLELIEGAALRAAIAEKTLESRIPYIRSFDVLTQYLITLAVSDGFRPDIIFEEVKRTFSFESLSQEEWSWTLNFITQGGESLQAYEEYQKVVVVNGVYKVDSKRIALRHRLSMGTIVGDGAMFIQYLSGKKLGTIEEWFIGQLKPGDVFWFAGRNLELVKITGMTALVRKTNQKTGRVPAWMGSRMPLSSQLSAFLRRKMDEAGRGLFPDPELQKMVPLVELQARRSSVPRKDQFLIEYFKSREGYHLLVYPFEGHAVHEGMASLIAWRLAQIQPISFTIAMNDYGFELLSDSEIPIERGLDRGIFSSANLLEDIRRSINGTELARRRFRDIASIAGLVFKGFPGREKKDRHLQSSSQLFFDVFTDYEPENLLLLQAYDEVQTFQLEETRLRQALERIAFQEIILSRPEKATPFSFPIIVDRLRGRFSNEKLEDRIKKMRLQLVRE